MKTAKEKFMKGQQVKMSPHGYQYLKPGKKMIGYVSGFCRSPFSVQILINGLKTPQSFWIGFWSKV